MSNQKYSRVYYDIISIRIAKKRAAPCRRFFNLRCISAIYATEIQVQGLELDFACVLWDADMRYNDGHWEYFKFNGKNKWNPVANTPNGQEEKKYMLNAYRVLLTRARQGIVICVPSGNNRLTPEGFPEDPTRLPEFYDDTYKYLKSLGIKEI